MEIGQRLKKVDCPGGVFEVLEARDINGLPHFVIARVDWPSDRRIFSESTLADERYFVEPH